MPRNKMIPRERREHTCGTQDECAQWIAALPAGEADKYEIVKNETGPPCSVFRKRKTNDATIHKPLARLTRGTFKVQGVSKDPMRPLWVELLPGDLIAFTPKGTSQTVCVPIAHLYGAARFAAARAAIAERRRQKKARAGK